MAILSFHAGLPQVVGSPATLNEFAAAERDYDQAQRLLEGQPNVQAHYGILVNRAALRIRQAQQVAGVFSLPWLRRVERLSEARKHLEKASKS